MTTFLIGAICGIAAFILLIFIISKIEDRRIKKEIGWDYDSVIIPKSENNDHFHGSSMNNDHFHGSSTNINRNVTICLKDDGCTNVDLDEDNNIIAFTDFHEANIKLAYFYESLFINKQIITIDYNLQMYKAIITQIKLIDENTLRVYYTVLK